jgi:catechol 2,3-dioxygenase-like lactoylglutathione lyase family enzyme
MPIELDHLIVSARDPRAAAQRLGELLGVPWAESAFGRFSPVYVSDGLTIDFIADPADFPVQHLCFRVDDATFDAILARLQSGGIPYRSAVHGPQDGAVSTAFGGRGVYWNDPERHQWEMLTVSYARRGGPG